MPWLQLKCSRFPSLTCYRWHGNVAWFNFFPSKHQCSALLKFQSTLPVIHSQRLRSPSQLYQILTYATSGNNRSLQQCCVGSCGQNQESGGISTSEILLLLSHYRSICLYSRMILYGVRLQDTSRCSHPSSSPQGPFKGKLPLTLWNLSRVLVLASENTAIGLKLSHKSVVTRADEHRFENVW